MKSNDTELSCGIVMPISSVEGYPKNHWSEVKDIIVNAAESTEQKFKAKMVNENSGETHIIHKTIIKNLYSDDIVVCDISSKNPNVLFELGMRLTFDKPTVIIKDDETDYIFDTNVIEHLTYPKNLRFKEIVEFKEKLSKKIADTYSAYQQDNESTSFLKSFGTFKVPALDTEKINETDQVILMELNDLKSILNNLVLSTQSSKDMKEPNNERSIIQSFRNSVRKYLSNNYDENVNVHDVLKDPSFVHLLKHFAQDDIIEESRLMQYLDFEIRNFNKILNKRIKDNT